ncbi:DNA-binding transcriptional MerR regulator [Catalinimonas alkaloidigena]|nr:DNA-binding transcriptional MerR regulator [Catalinimonas alkaloidigena]
MQLNAKHTHMTYKEKEIEKKYFSIGEVAEQLNIAPSQIRFWEGEFDVIKPQKNRNGKRQFTKEDIEKLKMVYHLVKEKGYTLQGAKQMIKNNNKGLKDKMEMIESLEEVKAFLVELKQKLDNQ